MVTAKKKTLLSLLILALLAALPVRLSAGEATLPSGKVAQSKNGMVAASTPYAVAAGVRMLEQGGNAADAAAAAAFALMVTDPPMTSLGGRVQIMMAFENGTVAALDGATWTPAEVPPREGPEDDRKGYQLAPVPGNPAALAELVKRYGRLELSAVLQPAIAYAEEGFQVTPTIAAVWGRSRKKLAADPGTAATYLKDDLTAYKEGEVFKNPRVARLLRALAESGPEIFYRDWIGEAIAKDMEAHGGYVRAADLAAYRSLPAVIDRLDYRGYEILMPARHARGHTLGEMLRTLAGFEVGRGEPIPEDVERVVRVIAEAFADRPSILEPIAAAGPALDAEAAAEYARERVERVKKKLGQPLEEPEAVEEVVTETTHLSVMDAEGNAVALTTSIGPVFGIGVATKELGFLYAHSYRLDERPLPHQRDYTEMTPTIVRRNGKVVLVVGAAGGARIPGAIFQVLSNVLDRGYSLEKAVAAPRVYARRKELWMHEDFPLAVLERMRGLGFELELIAREGGERHLGRVHAISFDPETGKFVGVADGAYDGVAAGPR